MTVTRFSLTRGMITLVNDNHMDNYHKESLAFEYYGSIVNILPQKGRQFLQKKLLP